MTCQRFTSTVEIGLELLVYDKDVEIAFSPSFKLTVYSYAVDVVVGEYV